MNKLATNQAKNSELLQELSQRIKDKRIRFTQTHAQCIGGLLSWDDCDKYWLSLTGLDEKINSRYLTTHWHSETKLQKSEPKTITNCQECQTPITMSQPDKKGRKILEFFGKWTGQGHKIVCQNCLEKKET